MPEGFPYFFFCYSRADILDGDPFVERLFTDLRYRVASLKGMGITKDDPDVDEKLNQVGFRDQNGILIGQEWKAKIGEAIQHNAVLVCLYSPNLFMQGKQFCGKEFTAFLLRNRGAHYVEAVKPNEGLELRGAKNIIPIFWENPKLMKKRKLPPSVLNDIQWTPDLNQVESASVDKYQTLGLRKISIRYRTTYRSIVDHIAESIVAFAEDPLPPLPAVPEIDNLRNAFWQPPHDAPLDATTAVPEPVVADVPAGPRRVLVMEVRHYTDEPWCPYPGDESIAAAVSQWTIRGQLGSRWLSLDPSASGFIEKALAAIQDAASPSCRTLLVVDPRCLSEESSRAAVVGLLRNPCRAGLLIPADAADEQAKSILESYEPELKSANNEGQWVIRPCVGTMGDFYIGADSVANDLLARIVLTDQVRQVPPDNDGPSVRPRMTNRLEDQQAA